MFYTHILTSVFFFLTFRDPVKEDFWWGHLAGGMQTHISKRSWGFLGKRNHAFDLLPTKRKIQPQR